MTDVRSWLPKGADTSAADAALSERVVQWSQHWFADAPPSSALAIVSVGDRGVRGADWQHCDSRVWTGIGDGGLFALGALAMGLPGSPGDRTHADVALFEKLGAECLRDLHRRLAELLAAPAGIGWSSGAPAADTRAYRSAIGPLTLAIALTPASLAQLVRARLPVPAAAPLASARDALAPCSLALSAMLGRCDITLADVEALAPGDVVVLDAALGAPLPLAIEHRAVPRGTCTISQQGERLFLQINQSPLG